MSHTYKNPWFKPSDASWGKEFYSCEKAPTTYKGFQIFNRAGAFDLVRGGVCCAQRTTRNGCKLVADGIVADSPDYFVQRSKALLIEQGAL